MNGITYYQTRSPYRGDFTKNCSLNGFEIDSNFLNLEGRDIRRMYTRGCTLYAELYNGETISTTIDSCGGGSGSGSCDCDLDLMTFITWSELRTLRDNSQLIPGMQYRITDYKCTTVQDDTDSTHHPFDIILFADDEHTLNENARAAEHSEPRPTFKLNGYMSYEGTRYDTESRWYYNGDEYVDAVQQIMSVWLPEDPSSVSMFGDNPKLYTLQGATDIQDIMTDVYINIMSTVMPMGVFVQYVQPAEIYPSSGMDYDNPIIVTETYFKNCNLEAWKLKYCLDNDTNRFAWAMVNIDESATIRIYAKYVYDNTGHNMDLTANFAGDTRIIDGETYYVFRYDDTVTNTIEYPFSINGTGVYDVSMIYYKTNDLSQSPFSNGLLQASKIYVYNEANSPLTIDILNIIQTDDISGTYTYTPSSNEGKGVIYYMKDDRNNELPYDFKNIMFKRTIDGSDVMLYTFIQTIDGTISDASVYKNSSSKEGVFENIITPYYTNYNNSVRRSLNQNVFYSSGILSAHSNTFGVNCHSNTFGNGCTSNVFGDDCDSNTFGVNCYSNVFGDYCHSNTFGNGCTSNVFGDDCDSNTFGNDCKSNTFGDNCSGITIQDSSQNTIDNIRYIHVFNNVSSNIYTDSRGNTLIPYDLQLQTPTYTQYVGKDTQGNLLIWNPADLVPHPLPSNNS